MAFCYNGMNEIDRNECIGNSLPKINENFLILDNAVCEISGTSVKQIVAGNNIVISPVDGTGVVTISSTAQSGSTGNEVLSAFNTGSAGASVFKEKVGQDLAFRKITAGSTNVTVSEEADVIRIYATSSGGIGGEANTSSNLGSGFGLASLKIGTNLPFKSLIAGTGVTMISSADTITINTSAVSVGTGTGEILKTPLDSSALSLRKLTAGSNISITTAGNDVTISSTDPTGATNIGTGTGQIFTTKSGNNLQLKTIKAGAGVVITNNPNDIQIDSTGVGGGEANTASNLGTSTDGVGLFTVKSGVNLPFKRVKAGSGITITEETNSITINGSAAGGDVTGGQNVGTAVPTPVGIFKDKLSGNLRFKSLAATGTNITVSEASDVITINSPNTIVSSQNIAGAIGEGSIIPATTKSGSNLQFKKLKAGSGITITDGTTDILLSIITNQSLTSNGYSKLPGGLIIQWGSTTATYNSDNKLYGPISFPITFNTIFNVVIGTIASLVDPTTNGSQAMAQLASFTNTGFSWFADALQPGPKNIGIHWIALGF